MMGLGGIGAGLRLGRISWSLLRAGALASLAEAGLLPPVFRLTRWLAAPDTQRLRPGERLALAARRLGPSFIKAGQALATRADLIGAEMAQDLAALQDRLPPFPAEAAEALIERELGRPLATLFSRFDPDPVAAASIAQVHFAVTADGRSVAVKLLRPGVERLFARDLELFDLLARLIEHWLPAARRLRPVAVVDTLRRSIQMETDLRFEAAAASELAMNFAGDPDFRVPAVDWALTARRVMTLDRVTGIRIDDRAALLAAGQDIPAVLTRAARTLFNQVFRDGFFHADQHPGNLFVAADGAVVAVDFGIMGRLDRRTRVYLADMLTGFLTGDYDLVARVHFDAGYVPANQSRADFTQACRSIGEPLLGKPLAEISLGRLLAHLFEITAAFQMETQPQLLLLQKTMLLVEGVGRSLDPTVNVWELARPLIEDWVRSHRGPAARIQDSLQGMADLAARLPVLLDGATQAARDWEAGGLRLHPDTVTHLAAALHRRRRTDWRIWLPLWVGVALLAVALFR